jgi:uncharacterized protein involved in cysteine biosynthesis
MATTGATTDSKSSGVGGLVRGVIAAVRGLPMALGSREVRRAYLRMVMVLTVVAMAVVAGLVYALWAYTDTLPAAGMWAVRIAGTIIALLAAPVLALLALDILFPLLAESVFFGGMRVIAPEQAAALEALPGLPLATTVRVASVVFLFFLGLSVAAFAVSLVPVVGPIVGPVAQLWITAKILGWELLDPYLDKREMGFAAQRQYVNGHQSAIVGFALPFAVLLAIPLIGPLFFGLAQGAAPMLLTTVLEPALQRRG